MGYNARLFCFSFTLVFVGHICFDINMFSVQEGSIYQIKTLTAGVVLTKTSAFRLYSWVEEDINHLIKNYELQLNKQPKLILLEKHSFCILNLQNSSAIP